MWLYKNSTKVLRNSITKIHLFLQFMNIDTSQPIFMIMLYVSVHEHGCASVFVWGDRARPIRVSERASLCRAARADALACSVRPRLLSDTVRDWTGLFSVTIRDEFTMHRLLKQFRFKLLRLGVLHVYKIYSQMFRHFLSARLMFLSVRCGVRYKTV